MEPFRAFVGDMLGKDQHSVGYAVQTAFIGAGAVVGSLFPSLMEAMGVATVAPPGQIPDTVRYAFWFGGLDRKSVVEGKRVSVRVARGGRRVRKKTTNKELETITT